MGQASSEYLDADTDDDIFSLLGNLLACFGTSCMFSGRNRRRQRKKRTNKGTWNSYKHTEYHETPTEFDAEVKTDEGILTAEDQDYNYSPDTNLLSDAAVTKKTILGPTGSAKYWVEVIDPVNSKKWWPERISSSVLVKLDRLPRVWIRWQQVGTDFCVFGIPVKNSSFSYLYITVHSLKSKKKNEVINVVRLSQGSKPMKNSLSKTDPRVFKLDPARQLAGEGYVLYHVKSGLYLGLHDNRTLALKEFHRDSVKWKFVESKSKPKPY